MNARIDLFPLPGLKQRGLTGAEYQPDDWYRPLGADEADDEPQPQTAESRSARLTNRAMSRAKLLARAQELAADGTFPGGDAARAEFDAVMARVEAIDGSA